MKTNSLKELQKNQKSLSEYPFFLVHTQEAFFLKEAISLIEKGVKKPDQKTEVLYADEMNLDSFIMSFKMNSLFGDPVYIIKNSHLFKDKDWDKLEEIFSFSHIHVIFVAPKIDQRKKVIKNVLKKVFYLDLKAPYSNQIPIWISYMLKKFKIQMSSSGVALIHHFFGSSLVEIENEILKLQQTLGKSSITDEDIKNYLYQTKKQDIYQFSQMIAQKKKHESFFYLNRLLKEGHHSLELLSLTLYHFRILIALKKKKKKKWSLSQMIEKTGTPSFFIKNYLAQVQYWSLDEFKKVIFCLYDLDKSIKSSQKKDEILWQKCLLDIFS